MDSIIIPFDLNDIYFSMEQAVRTNFTTQQNIKLVYIKIFYYYWMRCDLYEGISMCLVKNSAEKD